ncbi:hypothetical protein L1887_02289 [Cichorium endivia]|nr:hypothetical protein L1887_02289 [Cichorium endivia]
MRRFLASNRKNHSPPPSYRGLELRQAQAAPPRLPTLTSALAEATRWTTALIDASVTRILLGVESSKPLRQDFLTMASLRFSPFSSCTELSLPVPDPSGTSCCKRSLELYFGTIGGENKILRRNTDPECTLFDWNKRHKILLGVAVLLEHFFTFTSMMSYMDMMTAPTRKMSIFLIRMRFKRLRYERMSGNTLFSTLVGIKSQLSLKFYHSAKWVGVGHLIKYTKDTILKPEALEKEACAPGAGSDDQVSLICEMRWFLLAGENHHSVRPWASPIQAQLAVLSSKADKRCSQPMLLAGWRAVTPCCQAGLAATPCCQAGLAATPCCQVVPSSGRQAVLSRYSGQPMELISSSPPSPM